MYNVAFTAMIFMSQKHSTLELSFSCTKCIKYLKISFNLRIKVRLSQHLFLWDSQLLKTDQSEDMEGER
jgi:hypothetical protein